MSILQKRGWKRRAQRSHSFKSGKMHVGSHRSWLKIFFTNAEFSRTRYVPSSPVTQAVSYALNIEEEPKKFLKDSRLDIDNTPAERLKRGIAIIRKNCLFAGSEAGGQRLAILYSFTATCKANDICFRKWLKEVLPCLNSTPTGQIGSLLPRGEAK